MFIELSGKNAIAMLEVFAEFGFDTKGITPAFFMAKGQVVRLGREPLKLEILNHISGVSFPDCWRNRVAARLEGLRINFIDLEHLLATKGAHGRAKDQIDVTELTCIKHIRKK